MKRPVIAALVLVLAGTAGAGETVNFTVPLERLRQGEQDGIAIGGDGRLSLAPAVRPLGPGGGFAGAARAWSIAATDEGVLYCGTGPAGTIYRIRPGLEPDLLARLPEPMVTALAVDGDGTVLAGGSPGGRIYRITADGSVALWAETGERYVWDLAVTDDGRVFAATGENGRLLEIDRRGSVETLFQAGEPHLVRLVPHPQGGFLAGGGGRGALYRIDREGHGLTLFDDDLDQVTGVALRPDGSILAALMSAPEPGPGPAAIRFHLPGDSGAGLPGGRVETLEEPEEAIIEGRIEGLPDKVAGKPPRAIGRVVRILPSGGSRELWSSTTETPLAMAAADAGTVLFGTGSPGRLYRCDEDGATLLAELAEGMAGAMTGFLDRVAIATSNPAAPYAVERELREAGVYLSPVLDAGRVSRWGRVRWSGTGLPGEVEIYTRTGNGPVPDRTWSAWSPARTVSGSGPDGSPDGRYLQWRLKIPGGAPGASVAEISVACHPGNRPPVLESFRTTPDRTTVPWTTRFLWHAVDPDGDPPVIAVEYRRDGDPAWTRAALTAADHGGTWDTSALAEGRYRVRAKAGDHHANSWREGLWSAQTRFLTVVVDRTAPAVSTEPGADGLVLTATDNLSPVVRVEILAGGEVLFLGHPADGVADSLVERFLIPPPSAGDARDRTARVTDGAGNVAELPL